MWSISDKHLEEETMTRVWEQNNNLKSPITWFRNGLDLDAASRLVTRLESRFESACCENRAQLVVVSFSIDMSVTNLVDCNPSILNHISHRKWFCFLNGAVAKNRTITKPSWQVRRLSKLIPALLIYLYLFVCSATKRVPSFVEAWLCYAHGCTFLALLFMPSPNPLAQHLIEACNQQEKITKCHMYDSVMALGNGESTSHLLGFRTANVKEGSRSSHLFFIIKDTYNSCACFGWDTQGCILAIGTRDVRNKWVSKYASDLEGSSLLLPKQGHNKYPWVRQVHLD